MALPDLQTIEIRCSHCGDATVELDVDASQPLRGELNEKLISKDWDTLDDGVCPDCLTALYAEQKECEDSIPPRFGMGAIILNQYY